MIVSVSGATSRAGKTALAVLVLGERLGPRQWAGASLILGAVACQNLASLRRLRIPGRKASG